MLTLHTVRVGGHDYYVDGLVQGREEGTGLAGDAVGRWTGDGARSLGMFGDVGAEAFADVLAGREPGSGRVMGGHRNQVTVAAYDMVFCAPKSVSLLQALGPRELAAEVGSGHDVAVAAATDYVARRALGVRRRETSNECRVLPATGVVAGSFLHRTSRTLDPHLHTHLVVANLAQGVDGAWSAVDGRGLFAHVRAAGQLYRAHLRHELTARIGVAWDVRPSGFGDVVGVDPVMRGLFSQRSAAIREYLAQRGGRSSVQEAFYATRPEKNHTVTVAELEPQWRRRATEMGFEVGALARVVGRSHGHDGERFDVDALSTALADRDRPHATMSRRDVVAWVAAAHVGGATVGEVERTVERIVDGVPSEKAGRGPGVAEERWTLPAVRESVRCRADELTFCSNELGSHGKEAGRGDGDRRGDQTNRERRADREPRTAGLRHGERSIRPPVQPRRQDRAAVQQERHDRGWER